MAYRLHDTWNTLILHVPKTAGTFIGWALKDRQIPHHIEPGTGRDCPTHGVASSYGPSQRIVCCVRHPVAWIESWWRYHITRPIETRWFPYPVTYGRQIIPIHRECKDDFGMLIERILVEAPGLVTNLFRGYTDTADIVMRTESIGVDLARVIGVDETVISRMPYQNCSRPDRIAVWPEGLKAKWLRAESYILDRWYNAQV